MKKTLQKHNFPEGTQFYIKEFDIPLTRYPDGSWTNWFNGHERPYDITYLKPGNNWQAESFEEWLAVVEASYSKIH